ncbi:MAG: hypothetical protein DHS20C04_25850 [Hyphococcus sp.]|nr:MAG: hypothetical protein DHS20C04_25850 [Marinicaulis sp.]
MSVMIDRAFADLQSGDIQSARSLCDQVMQISPAHADALHLFGLIVAAENDTAKATEWIERAIAIDPNEPIYRLNIAALYAKLKNPDCVADHLRAAAGLAPNDANIRLRLASALLRLEEFESAAEAFEIAHHLEPNNVKALLGAVKAKLSAGALDDAYSTAMVAREKWPSNVAVLKTVCGAAIHLRKWQSLYETAAVWRQINPADKDAHRCLASAYAEMLDVKKARDAFKPIIDAASPQPADLVTYARYCLLAFDYDEAGHALDQAQKLAPQMSELKYAQARYNLFLGDLAKSEQYCREAIGLDPANPLCYAHMATITKGNIEDELFSVMQNMADDDSNPLASRATLYLSVGAVLHERKDFSGAMQAFDRGNELNRELIRIEKIEYDRNKAEENRRRDIRFFAPSDSPINFAPGRAAPVFIIGAPRSGTTLMESILAAHPQVTGAGELEALPVIHDAAFRWAEEKNVKRFQDIPLEKLTAWREEYFSAWPNVEDAQYVVDKQPMNIRSIGLIKNLFPEAKLIHVRRNPIETCFSIYRHDFSKGWPFASSLSDTGHYYGEYARAMAHWHEVLQQDLLHVQYEDLVDNFERHARDIISHCGLEWSDNCMAFYEVKRPIRTFSSAQVRSPISKNKQRVMDQYGEMLTHLIEALKMAEVDLVSGAHIGSP